MTAVAAAVAAGPGRTGAPSASTPSPSPSAPSDHVRTGPAPSARGARPGHLSVTTGGPRGPRLLLPPTAEPAPVQHARELAAFVAPVLRSAHSPVTEGAWPVPAAPVPARPAPLRDPSSLCGSIVLAAVEAINGTRPLVQLSRWVTTAVYDSLTAAVRQRTEGSPAAGGAGVPSRPVPAARGRATIRRSRVFLVSPTTAEASVVVHDGGRVRAAALRLQVHRGQWRVTVLQIG